MKYTVHMGISVRGVLRWPAAKMKNLFTKDDGSKPNVDEVRNFLFDKLAEGYEVIPMSKECNNWDKKTGCKGHNEDGTPRIEAQP